MRTILAILALMLAAPAAALSLHAMRSKSQDPVLDLPSTFLGVHLGDQDEHHGKDHDKEIHGKGNAFGHDKDHDGDDGDDDGDDQPVPEPGTALLFGSGLLGIAFLGKR